MRAAAGFLLLFLAAGAFAQYDVAVSMQYQNTPTPGSLFSSVVWTGFDPPRVSDAFTAMTKTPDGRVVAGHLNGSIFAIDPGGQMELVHVSNPRLVFAMTSDRNGVVYAIVGPELNDLADLIAIENGAIREIASIPFRSDAFVHPPVVTMDLAADQCTLWYPRNFRTVGRFNVCTATQLADIAIAIPPTGSALSDVRILPDGGALVNVGPSIHRLNAQGIETRSYLPPGGTADSSMRGLALGRDGRTLLTGLRIGPFGTRSTVATIDVESGALLGQRVIAFDGTPQNIVVADSWYAAQGNHVAGHVAVPALDTLALVLFAAVLTLVAIRRV